MHRRRFLQREAADYFGWHETYISQLLSGARTPGLDNAVQIERQTGIPVEAWMPSELDKANENGAKNGSKTKLHKA
jgi:transcriptional regulator with XRE-family HTH domain